MKPVIVVASVLPIVVLFYLSRALSGLPATFCYLLALLYPSIAFWMHVGLASRQCNDQDNSGRWITGAGLSGIVVTLPVILKVNLNSDETRPFLVAAIAGGYMSSWFLLLVGLVTGPWRFKGWFQYAVTVSALILAMLVWFPNVLAHFGEALTSRRLDVIVSFVFVTLIGAFLMGFLALVVEGTQTVVAGIVCLISATAYLFILGPVVSFAAIEGGFFYPSLMLISLIVQLLIWRAIREVWRVSSGTVPRQN